LQSEFPLLPQFGGLIHVGPHSDGEVHYVMKIGLKDVFLSLGAALAMSCFGFALLALGYYRAAQVVVVYPSSLFAYVVPAWLVERVPDGWLFFMGLASSVATWAFVLNVTRAAFHASSRRCAAA
jgi:hypothetical protein